MQNAIITDEHKAKVKAAGEAIHSNAQAAVDKLSQSGERAASAIKSGTDQFSRQASDFINTAAETGGKVVDTSADKANQLGAVLADNVRRNPVATLVAAVGLGFVLGVLSSR